MNILDRLIIEAIREPHEKIWQDAIREISALREAVEALEDFAGTVAPDSSWWDDVWPEHERAITDGDMDADESAILAMTDEECARVRY